MNLPNKLSMLRIILVPVMAIIFVLDIPLAPLWSAIIFILAAFTDFLDGYIARKYNMVTDLGKLLDPIADKLLVVFALFVVVESNIIPIGFGSVCAGIMVGRELLISAVRQIAAAKGVVIQANGFGKIKTIFQDIALPILLITKMEVELTSISTLLFEIIKYSGYVTFGISVVFALVSGIIYLVQNKHVFASK